MRPLAHSRDVFVDTSAFYAVAIPRDSNHELASATIGRLVHAKHRLITTNFVMAELHGLILSRESRDIAFEAVSLIKESANTEVERVEPQDEDRAWVILAQYDDKNFSLTDAISFAVMERLGLRTAFAFDRHFAQFGWNIMPLNAWGSG